MTCRKMIHVQMASIGIALAISLLLYGNAAYSQGVTPVVPTEATQTVEEQEATTTPVEKPIEPEKGTASAVAEATDKALHSAADATGNAAQAVADWIETPAETGETVIVDEADGIPYTANRPVTETIGSGYSTGMVLFWSCAGLLALIFVTTLCYRTFAVRETRDPRNYPPTNINER